MIYLTLNNETTLLKSYLVTFRMLIWQTGSSPAAAGTTEAADGEAEAMIWRGAPPGIDGGVADIARSWGGCGCGTAVWFAAGRKVNCVIMLADVDVVVSIF